MQQRTDLLGLDSPHRRFAVDLAFVDHVHRDTHGSGRAALAGARLEHVETAVLDGELEVLHLGVVGLQRMGVGLEFVVDLRQRLAQRADLFRRAYTGHHVFALGVEQVLPEQLRVAVVGIAREGHAGARALAHVAEDHRLHVAGRAPVVRQAMEVAVVHRAPAVPRIEDGLDRAIKLLVRVFGESLAGLVEDEALEVGRHRLPLNRG